MHKFVHEEAFTNQNRRGREVQGKVRRNSVVSLRKDWEGDVSDEENYGGNIGDEEDFERVSEMAKNVFNDNFALLNKWCMKLLCLIILTAGGQRPQVFSQLQAPSKTKLELITERCKEKGYFVLQTLAEKTMRSVDMPCVVLPAATCEFISFHMKYVRPTLLSRGKWKEEDMRNSENFPLLLNTRNGAPLTSQQVTGSLKKFMNGVDEGLGNVTTMTLRGSYATMMMRSYREKEIHTEMNEKEFVEHLAKCMNTSCEQLFTTYTSLDVSDFQQAARKMVSALIVATGNENLEKDMVDEIVESDDGLDLGLGD